MWPGRCLPVLGHAQHCQVAVHAAWAGFVQQRDIVVDATCGNGLDSLWLAKAVGRSGKLYAFDIQVNKCRVPVHFEALHFLILLLIACA